MEIGFNNRVTVQGHSSVVHIGERKYCGSGSRVYSDDKTTRQTSKQLGPRTPNVMNEKCFGTATTQSRILAEIVDVSRSSYTYSS